MIVWEKSVIHECPFEHLPPFGINLKANSNYILLSNESTLLKATGKVRECDIDMYKTVEGLYITLDEDLIKLRRQGVKVNTQTEAIFNLILSNIDFNSYKEYEQWKNVEVQVCHIYQSFLQFFTLQEDKYIRINNKMGQECIFYSSGGQVFVPKCYDTSKVTYYEGQVKTC